MSLLLDDEHTTNTDWFGADCARRYTNQEGAAWNLRHSSLEDCTDKWVSKESPVSELPLGAEAIDCTSLGEGIQVKYRDRGTALRCRAEEHRVEFETLSAKWQRDTKHLSLVSKKISHPAFLRIIGMGEPVIPLVLEALRDRPSHWFAALRATANVDPVPADANPSEAREAWLAWGRSKGYID